MARTGRLMRKVRGVSLLVFLVLAASLLLPQLVRAEPSSEEAPHVLILNSYHPGYLWSDNEQQGVLSTLREEYPDLQLHVEYLDTKNFPKPDHYNQLRQVLAYKYAGVRFSVVLALDNAALDFLAKFGKQLFGETPIVFGGVSNFSPQLLGDLANITGVVERHDVRSTLAAMLRLHPEATHIHIVVDTTLTGKELRRFTEKVLPGLSRSVRATFTGKASIGEVLAEVKGLKPGKDLVLLLTFARDREGAVFDLPELARLLSAHAPVPVYALQEERLGHGVVGGYLLGGGVHGAQVAQLALRVLAGEPAASLPVILEPPARPMFDHGQLARFGIRPAGLPEGSIIVNQPHGLYASYREVVWLTLAFIILLLCVIAALVVSNVRRREAEEVLDRNRAMLREVLDMAPQAIFWKDRASVYLGCNAVFARDVGLADPEEIVGKSDFDLPWPKEEAEAYRADDSAVMESNQAKRHISEPLQQADGKRLWIETTKVPLADAHGRVYGVLGVYEDVTEKKKAEEQLYLNRFVIDNSADSIFLVDEQARFHFVNDGACRRLGYSRQELLGLGVADVDAAFFLANWPAHWRELMARGALTFESRHRTKAGEEFPVEVSANRVTYGAKTYNCAFVRDISERKRTEEERRQLEAQLRQSQKMEAIGTLAGGIAHDFNNILSIIYGYTEMALLENTDPEEQRQHLGAVLTGAKRAKDLVQQILAFSRKSEQQKQPLLVAPIVKEALKMLRASLPTTIEIRQKIDSDGAVLADPTQIHQVIMNLCTNAYHAMRETGGVLDVALTEATFEPGAYATADLRPGRYLLLEVSDTGCGIDPEIREKIFEPYFTTKKHGEGTGLGLAVAHGIVKSCRGQIMVASEKGRGTSMRVYLPMLERERESAPVPPGETGEGDRGRGERILLVDDEAQICAYLGELLRRGGYAVSGFSDGEEAWREFAKAPESFDLLISDMTMPHMTGLELARKVLDLRPALPVILCTGHSVLVDREGALALGVREYLHKPVSRQEMLAAVRRALEAAASA